MAKAFKIVIVTCFPRYAFKVKLKMFFVAFTFNTFFNVLLYR